MRKLITTGLLAAAAAIATPAMAAPTIVWNLNNYTLDEPGATLLFGGYNSTPASTAGTPYVRNTTASASTPGEVTTQPARIFTNDTFNSGSAKDPSPATDLGNYLSIGANGSYTITFADPVQYFSFVLGTLDSYNTVTLVTTDGTFTYDGREIIGEATTGTSSDSLNGRVEYYFNGGPGLISATLSSTDTAFEVDQFASAVPEPATWAMMIVGFGAAGGALRSSRRRTSRDTGLVTA